jgi:hypothetical protein
MALESPEMQARKALGGTCSFLNGILLLFLKKCQDSSVYTQKAQNMRLDYTKGTVLL